MSSCTIGLVIDIRTALYTPRLTDVDPIIALSLFTVVILHLMSRLSVRSCIMTLKLQRAMMNLTFSRIYSNGLPESISRALKHYPVTVTTLHKWFPISSTFTTYAACPQCSRLYAPKNGVYPVMCTWDEFEAAKMERRQHMNVTSSGSESSPIKDGGRSKKHPERRTRGDPDLDLENLEPVPCNTMLVHDPRKPRRPIRPFKHRSMKEWLSKLLSRPGLTNLLDSAWTRADTDGYLRDIWSGSVLQNFRGPDGSLFSQPRERTSHDEDGKEKIQEGVTRLIFSMNIDWFNPYGNKQSGIRRSIGIIAFVCLNLPPHERYKRENMYVAGIIPGPNEPSLDQLNHFLEPIVEELLLFWHPGVRFSRTADHPDGRVVHAALVPVVSDLPASRKVHGAPGPTATRYCALCLTKRKTSHGFDPTKWPKRTRITWIQRASQWKNAISQQERASIFKKHGVRWTPLLTLPYWDPSEFVIVDSMHNLFLGLFKNHVLWILGVDITLGTKDESQAAPPTEHEMSKIGKIMEDPKLGIEDVRKRLQRFRKPLIQELCRQLGGVPQRVPPTSPSRSAQSQSTHRIRKADIIDAIVRIRFQMVSKSTEHPLV